MQIEKERKFLVRSIPKGLFYNEISQAYLLVKGQKQLRVRLINNEKAFICYKQQSSEGGREEYEYQIPYEDGCRLYQSAAWKVVKSRASWDSDGLHFDLDRYWDGDNVLEIEYSDELTITMLPEWVGEEVTGIEKFSNIYKASQWKES